MRISSSWNRSYSGHQRGSFPGEPEPYGVSLGCYHGHLVDLTFVLAAAYFTAEFPEAVDSPVDYCRRNKLPLIRGFEANAHHTECGSTDCKTRDESLSWNSSLVVI